MTITIKIKEEITEQSNIRKNTNLCNNKKLKNKWEKIAEAVKGKLTTNQYQVVIDNDDSINHKWSFLKNVINVKIGKMIKALKTKEKNKQTTHRYGTDISKLSVQEKIKRKIKILGDIELQLNKWKNLKTKEEG